MGVMKKIAAVIGMILMSVLMLLFATIAFYKFPISISPEEPYAFGGLIICFIAFVCFLVAYKRD